MALIPGFGSTLFDPFFSPFGRGGRDPLDFGALLPSLSSVAPAPMSHPLVRPCAAADAPMPQPVCRAAALHVKRQRRHL